MMWLEDEDPEPDVPDDDWCLQEYIIFDYIWLIILLHLYF